MEVQQQGAVENAVRNFWSKGMLAGMKKQTEQEQDKEKKFTLADAKNKDKDLAVKIEALKKRDHPDDQPGKIEALKKRDHPDDQLGTKIIDFRKAVKMQKETLDKKESDQGKSQGNDSKRKEREKLQEELKAQMVKLEKQVRATDNVLTRGGLGKDGKKIDDFATADLSRKNSMAKSTLQNVQKNLEKNKEMDPSGIRGALSVVKNNSKLLKKAHQEKEQKEKMTKHEREKEHKKAISINRSVSRGMER